MEFIRNCFIVLCKEPEIIGEYFAGVEGENTGDIVEAEIFHSEREVIEFIEGYDEPDKYTYKPIEITYKIKNVKIS